MRAYQIKKGLFYGQIAGLAYFISTLIFFWPNEELFLIKTLSGKIHFFLYSTSLWMAVFALLMAVLHLIGGHFERRKTNFITEFLSTSVVLFFVLAGYGIYFYYDLFTPPHYPSYLLKAELIRVVLIILAVSVLGGIIGHLKLKLWRKIIKYSEKQESRMNKLYKLSVITFSFLFLYVLASSVFINFSSPKKKEAAQSKGNNVYVLGLDGASWNILVPLMKDGALPNMAKMIEEGSYGHFDTYGEQFTPPVWASIATGKAREKHAINKFENSIYHWRAKPLWEIVGEKGDKTGVVNWMNAYPAVDINGFMLSNSQGKLPFTFYVKYPDDFDLPPEKLFLPVKIEPGQNRLRNMMARLEGELENSRRVLDLCHNLHSYRALLTYIYAIDGIQHYFWSDFMSKERIAFSSGWKEIDTLIGDIARKINEDTYLCILSDHGSRYINKPETVLDLEKVLEIIDYPISKDDNSAEPLISVVNEELITVSGEMSNRTFSQLVTELRNIKFSMSNKPVFSAVNIIQRKERRLISLKLTRHLKVMPENPPQITIKEKGYSYDDIIYFHPWSGRHRARGMIIVKGPGVKRKFLGAWVVDSPYGFLFRLMHGRAKSLDRIYPLLKFFHITDPVTTLDLTPTLLTLLGYPGAKDMDGKDFSSSITTGVFGRALKPVKSYGRSRYYDESKKLDDDVTKKIKDEMRALGYIK